LQEKDMAFQFINYNGEIFPADHPVMTISNRGFRYGDGLFETIRVMKGEVKFAEYHAERLQKGMIALKIEGYSKIDGRYLSDLIKDLMKRNDIGQNARARITVFRDGDGLYSPTSNKFGYAIELNKLEESAYVANTRGLIVDVFDEVTKPLNSLSNYKTCNSLVYVMAGIYRLQNNLDEVFILNQNGFLCEAMASNIFVVYDKQLYTPDLSEGCISGVMRRVIMDIARENEIPLIEAQINPEIMNEAEEVFVTNASRGVQWVMGYNNKRYFNELSRFLLDKLNK
jgi:branched-subunit amino acid aminotransferase/4-amino-4-deoxychorismate lyase